MMTGCSGEAKPSASDKKESTPSASASATGPAPTSSAPGPDAVSDGPKVPDDELTPATGSFDKKEKEYLKDRVPEGVEPAAILEAGEEACRRIEATAAVDEQAARDAIASGEIANAKDAIKHLCPEFEDLLP
ncbi:hypothetical protein AB0M28_14620 [Streptomyces sp. NPDC051940]|uniref:hypothetical protein n=1 Tax=Streptomyces sp. NPDC051940 TaxID=3155675 RepID=UPI003428E04B